MANDEQCKWCFNLSLLKWWVFWDGWLCEKCFREFKKVSEKPS